ncbi:folylpolyglutamate synthase/dihydrofolate synthase family protein [Leptotrichia sp. oral taxon 223]|uniref:bifunctional folylpolyglutamate synthase/dihydrofolate synthase n=1 Tax=Leptotrichia sp. oral taxon 223 TaxID=712363 RepID=UPI0015BC0495|nr:Mur ligase family protein [Leptotrichia sp. oral taxon 223]NWO18027.1 bifunctional folylpolyglutamate synthase/dihydrofolate synthase [Leptotrichia sp. oral taxon 223]
MKESLYGEKKRVKLLAEILDIMNNPASDVQVIHVSGTNGKGSTCYMINSILCEMGYKVGLFTSPQIRTIYELIKVNGVEITELEFEECKNKLRQVLNKLDLDLENDLSYFEMVFLIAMIHFKNKNVNVLILECGLGGELDATNAVSKIDYTIFTKIGIDHKNILGNTIEEICRTKSKIIRKQSNVIIAPNQRNVVYEILEKEAKYKNCDIFLAEKNIKIEKVENIKENRQNIYEKEDLKSENSLEFQNKVKAEIIKNYDFGKNFKNNEYFFRFGLKGNQQLENLATVLMWYFRFYDDSKNSVENTEEILDRALGTLKIAGRMEKVEKIKNVYLDVAHNEDSVEAFVDYVKKNFDNRKKIFVVGFLKDKEVEKCVNLLKIAGDNFILTEPNNEERKLDSEILERYFEDKKIENPKNIIISEKNIEKAFLKALELRENEDECIFVVGSFYLLGEVKKVIEKCF